MGRVKYKIKSPFNKRDKKYRESKKKPLPLMKQGIMPAKEIPLYILNVYKQTIWTIPEGLIK